MREAGLSLPEAGNIAVFAPPAGADLGLLPLQRCHVIGDFKPDYDHYSGFGYQCFTAPQGRYGAAVIYLPRAKALARALVAQAARITDGPVIVDGAKTDGVESLLRD